MRFRLILVLVVFCAALVTVFDRTYVEAPEIYVIDGDTIRLDSGESIRLVGIDTPEIRNAECASERAAGLAAKDRLRQLVDGAAVIRLERRWRDKYGRTLAILTIDGRDAARLLVAEGHGRVYRGRKRSSWCTGVR